MVLCPYGLHVCLGADILVPLEPEKIALISGGIGAHGCKEKDHRKQHLLVCI